MYNGCILQGGPSVLSRYMYIYLSKGHFTVIEPSKFQNETMKSSNINALFCHTNTKMPENYNFLILVHCYPIIN